MATVPNQRTWTNGDTVDATMLNANVRDAVNFLLAPPAALLRQTVAQSIGTTGTAVTFDTEDYDNDGGHSTVTNTTRYTAVTPGWYRVSGSVGFNANPTLTSTRWTEWRVNSTAIAGSRIWLPQAQNSTDLNLYPARVTRLYLNAGDFVELIGAAPAGSITTYVANPYGQSTMLIEWAAV